ncbi:MoxR family ATPase [Rheinheimera riviphila]|uniref:MoxR family ATPase n=1 Tax=Rheinheimera riviphila TaxID=1834037 RepID=A0A437QT38_9GAMM|nr:MoxR family ATPase [Rheinheimera riviphila]RVU37666.1 MoxR family ATPase [Rheinheimera riviphila]
MSFQSNDQYIVSAELALAVNAAIALEKPLLIKGEPGTGKTQLALQLARSLQCDLIQWHIKSTTKAQQGLYEYDAVSRLRDSQLGDSKVQDIANYIKPGKLWQAFTASNRPILLIDEIDKADIEFPNDLLHELDQMAFDVYETGQTIKAKQRPIVIITSNNEKELPDAFLRRCFFHYIRFPDKEALAQIVDVHLPDLRRDLLSEALELFFGLREMSQLKKKPSTSELIDWLKLLLAEQIPAATLAQSKQQGGLMPLYGALLKNEQDVALVEKLLFMAKRAGR